MGADGSTEVDVVVVGARVAGTSTAVELARSGLEVIAIDSASFPSDTLSTHIIWPETVAELDELGALKPLLLGASPHLRGVHVQHGGHVAEGTFRTVGGIDFALCPRRTRLDAVLVDNARDAGVDVREHTSLRDLLWQGQRVSGVSVTDRSGHTYDIRARLVVGADGRRSTVARLVGASAPYRQDPNGRGLVFAYYEDPRGPAERTMLSQWRVGDTLGNYFPTDDGTAVVLFMGPREHVPRFSQDGRYWESMLAGNPALQSRVGNGARLTKLLKAADTGSYFRRSTGPGWALVGDAGHFKDPVIAQGIRDAVHYGRSLGQQASLGLRQDDAVLDRRLRRWERRRDRECLAFYYWALRVTRTHPVTPIEAEAFHHFESDRRLSDQLADVFGRQQRPRQLTSLPRLCSWTANALRAPGANRGALAREVRAELTLDGREARDILALRLTGRIAANTTRQHP